VLVWLSVCSQMQIVCIWSSWCHCHPQTPSYLASFKSRLVLPFWYRRTQVVLEKRPLNGCSSSRSSGSGRRSSSSQTPLSPPNYSRISRTSNRGVTITSIKWSQRRCFRDERRHQLAARTTASSSCVKPLFSVRRTAQQWHTRPFNSPLPGTTRVSR